MKKQLLTLLLLVFSAAAVFGQKEKTVIFSFAPSDNVFYSQWGGNDAQIDSLYRLIDKYRTEISSGSIPVYVDGYSASGPNERENTNLSFVRSNRVKSQLITNKGLVEDNFVTKNHATVYVDPNGVIHRDMVVVTLRIPVREEPKPEPQPAPAPAPEPQPIPAPEPIPEPQVESWSEPQPVAGIDIEPTKRSRPFCFAVRTNLLYDAFLLPTLGVEWRINPSVGVKLDGSRSWWGNENGKVQKIWLLNPEVRWYMLENNKCFYVGVSANLGCANVYEYLIGNTLNSLYSDDTGYQGAFWGAGVTVGYELCLSPRFYLDFNLGLGYTRFEYDTFELVEQVRVYKDRDIVRNFWGPTQAGVSLAWKICVNKQGY